MIEDADIYNMEGVFYSLGDIPVGLTWFGHARRVVVRQNTGGGIAFEGGFNDLSRMDACPVNSAPEQLIESNNAVPVVEPENGEDLMFQMAEAQLQELFGFVRRGKRFSTGKAPGYLFLRRLDDFFA